MDPALNYSTIPSQAPPPGITPNFTHPATNEHVTTVVVSILLPLMLAFIALRLHNCLWVTRRFAKSDCEWKIPRTVVVGLVTDWPNQTPAF